MELMLVLKTVFEVNLQLFPNDAKTDKKSKSLLLFVIRDHLGTTPISNLSQSINKDLSKIWSSLSKVWLNLYTLTAAKRTRKFRHFRLL